MRRMTVNEWGSPILTQQVALNLVKLMQDKLEAIDMESCWLDVKLDWLII